MNSREISIAIDNANQTMRAADLQAFNLAKALEGRLRQVSKEGRYLQHEILVKLKKELSQYDARKREWKN